MDQGADGSLGNLGLIPVNLGFAPARVILIDFLFYRVHSVKHDLGLDVIGKLR